MISCMPPSLAAFVLAALASTTAPFSLTGTAYPRISVSVYSHTSSLTANQPVFFDLSGSTVDDPAAPVYVLYQFGDADVSGTRPAWKTETAASLLERLAQPPASFAYNSPGTYRANVTLSDRPFFVNSSFPHLPPSGVTGSGYPAPVANVEFTVLPVKSCYQYGITVDWDPLSSEVGGAAELYGGGDVLAYLTVVAPQRISADLTQAFVTMGDIPSLTIKNLTNTYELMASVNKDMTGWTAVIPAAILNGRSGVTAVVSSSGTSVMSCSIGETTFDISVPYLNSLTIGFDMSRQLNGVYPGKAFVDHQYKPLRMQLSKDICFPRQSLIVLGIAVNSTGSRNYLGGQVIVTNSNFEDGYQLRDLLRGPDGTRADEYSLCKALTDEQCKELLVMDAVVVDYRIYFLTSAGVFYTDRFRVKSKQPLPTKFTRAVTGVAELDSPTADYVSLGVRMYGRWDCSRVDPRYIYLAYNSAAGEPPSNLVVSSTENAVRNIWTSPVQLPTLLGHDGGYRIVQALRLPVRNFVLYLVGKLSGLSPAGCSGFSCLYDNAMTLRQVGTFENSAANVSVGFVFPADAVFRSLYINNYDLTAYAYGDGAWMSIDATNQYRRLFRLDGGETVTSAVAEPAAEGVAFTTNLGSVYHARPFARDTVKVRTFVKRTGTSPPGSAAAQMEALTHGVYGEYRRLQFDHPDGYPANSSLYPRGFLKGPSGELRDAPDPFLRSLPVPVRSAVPAADLSFPATLVPSIVGYERVRFYAYDPAGGGRSFEGRHVGSVIRSRKSGAAKIMSLNKDSTVADCLVIERLVPESASDSPAVGLTLSALNFSAARVSVARMDPDAPPPLTPVRLELDLPTPQTPGWLPGDVGKTVLVTKGSVVITDVLDAAVAIGSVVFEPVGGGAAPLGPGQWQLYDYRSVHQEVRSATQSLSVVAAGSNNFLATLTSGVVKFDAYFVGSVLKAGGAWAVVSRYIDSSSLQVSTFDIDAAGTYPSGNWSFSRTTPEYVYGAIPDATTLPRSWTLTYDVCRWTALETSSLSLTDFASRDGPSVMNVSSRVVRAEGLAASRYLAADAKLGMLGNYFSSGKFDAAVGDFDYEDDTYRISAYVASSRDDPSGKALLAIRPAETSPMCDTPAPVLTVIQACPPTKSIHVLLPVDSATLLADDGTLTELLPTNYRPPSSRGRAIPLTANVYNADPSKPRYRDVYSVSKATGSYKQCAGKADRAACGCTDEQRLSPFERDSDCIDRVVTVTYDKHYAPNIYIVDAGEPDTDLKIPYRVVEVNNRTDYCFDYATTCDAQTLQAGVLNPLNGDEIRWHGDELYHFRVDAAFGTFCTLSTEFKVWVTGAPSRAEQDQAVMSLTAIGFCVMLFTVYLVHSYRHST